MRFVDTVIIREQHVVSLSTPGVRNALHEIRNFTICRVLTKHSRVSSQITRVTVLLHTYECQVYIELYQTLVINFYMC